MEGINVLSAGTGFSTWGLHKIFLKSPPVWSIIFDQRGDADDDFEKTEGLFLKEPGCL
jgi:hypothetical protein